MGSRLLCPQASRALLRSGLACGRLAAPSLLSTPPSPWLAAAAGCQVRRGPWDAPRAPTAASAGHSLGPRRSIFSSVKVVRKYEDLPRSYRDQDGLSFGNRELGIIQTKKVFGPDLSPQEANQLLRILHGRRVAGTLDDPAFAIHTAQFTQDQMEAGLAHLREAVPVDEVVNAGLRAEDELEQLEREQQLAQERQDKKKKRKPAKGPKETEDAAATAEYKPDPIYGPSLLDEIRVRNIARQKAQDNAAKELRQLNGGSEEAGPLATAPEPRLPTNPAIAEYHRKAQSDLEAPPEMKAWERIVPSATVVVLVLGFLAAVCTVYEEPEARYRLVPDISAAQATLGAIVGVNVLVWLAWKAPPLWRLLNRYMILVVATVKPVTLFTAPFSHKELQHLAINMVPLWFMGTRLHDEMGRADFLTLYVGCGAVGFLGSVAAYTLRGWLTVTSLGASGATLGIVAAYLWEHRDAGFRVLGLPRDGVQGIVFLAMLVAMQLGSLATKARFRNDVASHLAGMATGVAGMELRERSRGRGGQGQGRRWGGGPVPLSSSSTAEAPGK